MKKFLLGFCIFLIIINVFNQVKCVSEEDVEKCQHALGVTDEELKKSREEMGWDDFYEHFMTTELKDLSNVDLIRALKFPEDEDKLATNRDSLVVDPMKDNAFKEANTRAAGGDTVDNDEYEKKRKEAVEINKEILKEKDSKKLKELKKKYIKKVEEMLSENADMVRKDENLVPDYNDYVEELGMKNKLFDNMVDDNGEEVEEQKSNKIYKQPNIITGRGNVDGTLDDMISDADSFVSKGNQADAIEIDGLKKLSVRLYDILLEIGVGAAVLIGIILGIKFLLSGVEEKAEVQKMIWVYTVGCIVTFGAFGIWKLVVTILQKI